MDGEKKECDETMNFLAVGMQWLVTSCCESTPPPYGEKEPYSHIQLITTNEFYSLTSAFQGLLVNLMVSVCKRSPKHDY